jgi:serine phosphatase RsbU (regulator of sigma subunit)/DNA-binding NarL/FixJ family response regulator
MTAALHLLLIEDDPSDAALIVRVLSRSGFDVSAERVETAADTQRILAAGGIDMVIADYSLPSFTGVEALGILSGLHLETPLVIVSGTIDAPTALAAMKAGAKDYVLKDELDRLPEVIRRELEEARNRLRGVEAERERDRALDELRAERQREQRAHRLAEALNAVNEPLLSTLSLDEILERVLTEACVATGSDKGLLLRPAEGGWVVRQTHGVPDDLRGRRFSETYAAAVTEAARSRRPLMVEDTQADPLTNKEFATEYGITSYMVLPVLLEGEVVASMSLSYSEPRTFGEEDLRFAERLGTALSLALHNARMYEAEHDIAETLQAELLSMPHDIPGVRFAYAYNSAAQAARVGGDFYDVFELGQGLLAVAIGDVSGKGLEAAALTSLLKSSLRAHALEKGMTPADVVARTSDIVLGRSAANTFVTAFFAILDRRDGRLVYCNAGHANLALVAREEVRRLEPNSPLLGALPGVVFAQTETRLDEGDVLFLYTDGLTEARRDGEQFGEERVFARLEGLRGKAPDEMVDCILEDVLGFAGGRLSDDLALLAVARAEPGELGPFQTKLL